jgi:hypothetical protein
MTVAVQIRAFASPPSGLAGNVIQHLRELVMQARSAVMSASQGESARQHVIAPACHLPQGRLSPAAGTGSCRGCIRCRAGRSVLYDDCSMSPGLIRLDQQVRETRQLRSEMAMTLPRQSPKG